MRNLDIWKLHVLGLQAATSHDVSPAHAYKLTRLKKEVREAVKKIVDAEQEILKDEGVNLEDPAATESKIKDMRKKMSELTSDQKKEYDDLKVRYDRYKGMHDALMEDDTPLEGIKSMPYDAWHQLQAENRSKKVVMNGRAVPGVDIFSGELEFILEDVLWKAPEDEDGNNM